MSHNRISMKKRAQPSMSPPLTGRKSACPSEGRRYAAVIGELSKTISKAQAHDTKEDEDSIVCFVCRRGIHR